MRTHAEWARALLFASGLPRSLWAEAMLHSVWIENRMQTHALNDQTPYEAVTGNKPHLGSIQAFVAAAYVKNLKARKLDEQARKGRLVGYDFESKGYQIYWPGRRTISIERDVVFNYADTHLDERETVEIRGDMLDEGEMEKILQKSPNDSKNPESLPDEPGSIPESIDDSPIVPIETPDPQVKPTHSNDILLDPEPNTGRGMRARLPAGAYRSMHHGAAHLAAINFADALICEINSDPTADGADNKPGGADDLETDESAQDELDPLYLLAGSMQNEPPSMSEALRGPNAAEWQKVLEYEIGQLQKLRTWDLVDKPPKTPVIPCSEVLQEKRNADDVVESRRVRIVAGGHRQTYGVNYTETFSSAVKMPSVRVILALAAQMDWEIHQIDIKSAYLNAPLKEEVYMHPPRGVLKAGQEGKVCRLRKAMYGLKQAGHEWYETLAAVFYQLGYSRSSVDHSVFYKRISGEIVIVTVATDDMAVIGSTIDVVKSFKRGIASHFGVADLGKIHWYLGFEIKRNRKLRTISINQKAYIEAMATKFGLADAKPVSLPALPGEILSRGQSPSTPAQVTDM